PRVRPGRKFNESLPPRSFRHAILAYTPARFGSARSWQADEIRHVAAADEQAATIYGVANELCDPSDGLRLDLGGSWRERPCANVRVYRCGQKVPENPDRCRGRRRVSEGARESSE